MAGQRGGREVVVSDHVHSFCRGTRPFCPRRFLPREIIERFEQDKKWGREATLYGYVQQYFAWLDGRSGTRSGVYLLHGDLFDPDPVLDDPQLRIDDGLFKDVLLKLSRETMPLPDAGQRRRGRKHVLQKMSQVAIGRPIDYSQINPRILGNIYERFLGYVIEIKERRLDPQVGRDTRRKEGTFYTPQSVTKFLVEHCVNEALARLPGRKPWELVCLDPACGSGHFLVEYVNYVAARCEDSDDSRSYQQWKRYVTQHGVFGVDKDSTAVMLTKLSLWINSAMQDEPFVTIDTHVKCGNSLVCGTPPGFRLANFEKRAYPEKFRELKRLRKELAELESRASLRRLPLYRRRSSRPASPGPRRVGQDRRGERAHPRGIHQVAAGAVPGSRSNGPLALGNRVCRGVRGARRIRPPRWQPALGRRPDRNPRIPRRRTVRTRARGQYDSYELFIELGRRLLREGGIFGFIIPDSVTLPEHEPLRRMLLDQTALTRLVRAGEGIFPSVFRAAFFLCFANQPPPPEQQVRVATLRKDDRRLLEEDTLVRSQENDSRNRRGERARPWAVSVSG